MKLTSFEKFKKAIDTVYESEKYQKLRQKMNRHLQYFQGHFWSQHPEMHKPADSNIFVNYIFSTVMSVMPLLTDNRPTWYVRARKAYMQRYFNLFNDALEYLWDFLECDTKLSRVETLALLFGAGVWKVYYDPHVSPDGEVAIDIVDPRTFVIAPGYDDPWEAPWSGTFGERPLSWVWDNYPKAASKVTASLMKEKGTLYDKDKWSSEDAITHNVKIYEIYLKDDSAEKSLDEGKSVEKYPYGRFVVFTDQKDEDGNTIVLDDRKYRYKHAKAPYVTFYDYWNPFEFHGISEPDQIESLNLEFNLQIKRLANFCRRFTGLNIFKSTGDGIETEQFKTTLAKGDDNVWELNDMESPPLPLTFPNVNSTLLEFISALPKLIEEVSAVTEISKGMVGKKERQTAGEIATLIESSYTRTRERVRNLERAVKRACYLFVCLMQQFYKKRRPFVKMEGGEPAYGEISSDPRELRQILAPQKPPPGPFTWLGLGQEDAKRYEQDLQDYEEFFSVFGEMDSVYAEFDIEIQTNSTLPMDKQSLANLFLRLWETKGVDRLALLRQLRIPEAEEIAARMDRAERQLQAPQRPKPQIERSLGAVNE